MDEAKLDELKRQVQEQAQQIQQLWDSLKSIREMIEDRGQMNGR